ncbi:MAG: aminomethyl-transferring glycine dehydrogenase [Melioribacter sp.]|uniref:aminomethyl-transferring glycine dehydrogenase n=1 Tax=Melioribacter sp. TaxID=2052167 RepID=UPI003BEDC17D
METPLFNDKFVNRHVGPDESDIKQMCDTIAVSSLDELVEKALPESIRSEKKLELDEPLSEYHMIERLTEIANENKLFKNYIGLGYYPVILPGVIRRNILENPDWYTPYTPYQAEISQGRLEALLNFQTMIIDMTGLPIANASLLDEATAAAEAMAMLFNFQKNGKKNANKFFVSNDVFPQTIEVLKTRSEPIGIELVIDEPGNARFDESYFGLIVQYPASSGKIIDYSELFKKADEFGILKAVAADLMSLALLTPPGEFGADVAVGATQRFGVPMGFGGPHAAYFATKEEYKRFVPGRIIGVSIDRHGNRALRMALQTREQHIKREHATSNICTSQALLAVMASMYAVYHGPEGIKNIAERIHYLTSLLNSHLKNMGLNQLNDFYFDTLLIKFKNPSEVESVRKLALERKINFRYTDTDKISISISQATTFEDIAEIVEIFDKALGLSYSTKVDKIEFDYYAIPDKLKRRSPYLTHPVFNKYHSETELMRYIKSLTVKDFSLTTSMISLGSCTMKLNAATEMFGISWEEFTEIHPFAPSDQAEGYFRIIKELGDDLMKITGFKGISFQPNSGAQGEYTGLMVIRAYHKSRGEGNRNIVLIPSSAHGTNPASAVMAGNKVVVVKCDENGNIDLNDLKSKAEEHKDNLSALMVTYPSTHGVFEEDIVEICKIIHDNGGQVYMDGANLNALVGLAYPAEIGADVCHINLHKTFAIPHGGGGPGMGPIAVAEHLKPFLPGHPLVKTGGENAISAVSAAPFGSPLILIISYAYIKMMGGEGLTHATKAAILNANYLKEKLKSYFPVLYSGKRGFVAHELIFDTRKFKQTAKIDVDDIAKRLMDYGFHAPTVSFPVPGTLMVEPTESESKYELDRFCDAMISIYNEIKEIEEGKFDAEDNVLKNAPHTPFELSADEWNHSYTRTKAAFPVDYLKIYKPWVSVGRINNAYGDRNLICSCPPVSQYE